MALNDNMAKFYRRELGLLGNVLSGTFTGTGSSSAIEVAGKFNILITDGVGTVDVERSFDNGATYYIISKNTNGDGASYTTASNTAFNGSVEEPEDGILYRLTCSAYTSGTIIYRISQ